MASKKRALGRGLSALLESVDTDITTRHGLSDSFGTVAGSISDISVTKIEANPFQPRSQFSAEALEDLAQSIKVHGVIQPITVRKLGNDTYQLISGERRWRATQQAGLTTIPAYVRIADDQSMLEMALIENIQRENLDAMEVAISYQRLIEECKLTQEQLGERVGKKRSTVTNYLRLLNLPDTIQLAIREGKISMGHARALLAVDDTELQKLICEKIISESLSVRKVEDLVKFNSDDVVNNQPKTPKAKLSETEKGIVRDLVISLNRKVQIQKADAQKGKLTLHFDNQEELLALFKKLKQ
ncbi:MAG: ParB/RepB/Spo0J family partition protein [Flavobacteriales bacterium]|nr:ParB/RepB/Spo0J family partition protein [Flavobacteriales bacterium]